MGECSEMILLSILSYLATCTTAFNSKWCTGQFTCDTVDLFMQQQGYHSVSACKSLCQDDGRCSAYTLWKDTSLPHWSQCWLFSQCVETDCIGCESGKLGDGCDSQDTTTEPPTTNAPGDTCPPLPDNGGHWTCFPLPDNGGHWTCFPETF